MDRDLRDRWVARLRDPATAQGTDRLCTVYDDGRMEFCCLGVLAEILAEDGTLIAEPGPGIAHLDARNRQYRQPGHQFGNTGILPEGLAKSIGFDVDAPGDRSQQHLAEMNDRGCSFEQIADEIERIH